MTIETLKDYWKLEDEIETYIEMLNKEIKNAPDYDSALYWSNQLIDLENYVNESIYYIRADLFGY